MNLQTLHKFKQSLKGSIIPQVIYVIVTTTNLPWNINLLKQTEGGRPWKLWLLIFLQPKLFVTAFLPRGKNFCTAYVTSLALGLALLFIGPVFGWNNLQLKMPDIALTFSLMPPKNLLFSSAAVNNKNSVLECKEPLIGKTNSIDSFAITNACSYWWTVCVQFHNSWG